MSVEALALPLQEDFLAGVDVGGTKVHIVDTITSNIHRYDTAAHIGMEAVLDRYFAEAGARPGKVCIGMAGPRDDETGAIKMTNSAWPLFEPSKASAAYETHIDTENDMEVAVAGLLNAPRLDILELKAGTPTETGTKVVVTISTGLGLGAAVWDKQTKRFVRVASEGGHIGFQPKEEHEVRYAEFLHQKYPHASAELALAGSEGIDNLIEHSLQELEHDKLTDAIIRARDEQRPVGTVLLAFATAGEGVDQEAARQILARMGAIAGSFLRDAAVMYKATGGVFLIGSVSLGLAEYLAEHTDMNKRFVREGANHDTWLDKIPISLITDPHIAAYGALALAKEM